MTIYWPSYCCTELQMLETKIHANWNMQKLSLFVSVLSVGCLRQSITAQTTIGHNTTGPAGLKSKRRSRITIWGLALILLEKVVFIPKWLYSWHHFWCSIWWEIQFHLNAVPCLKRLIGYKLSHICHHLKKTSQELQILNCQNCNQCNKCLKCHKCLNFHHISPSELHLKI